MHTTEDERLRLRELHRPEAIRRRLGAPPGPGAYVRDAVLGGIDGCVTTFGVVTGSAGAGFSPVVALVLGLANLVADAFSMAISNYQAVVTQRDQLERAYREENRHIDEIPEGQREEVRQIFARKGFRGDVLEDVVNVISRNRQTWSEVIVAEETGVHQEATRPLIAASVTFGAFVLVGAIPLLPLFFERSAGTWAFPTSAAVTAGAFFVIGAVKGRVTARPAVRSGFHTLAIGGGAAILSYMVAGLVRTALPN